MKKFRKKWGKIKKIGKKLVFLLNNFGTWQYLLIFCNLSRGKGYWARRRGVIIHGYVIYTGLIDIFISFFCLNGSRSNILFYTRNLKLNDCDGFFLQQFKKNIASVGIRTRCYCLEGSYANHWTIDDAITPDPLINHHIQIALVYYL